MSAGAQSSVQVTRLLSRRDVHIWWASLDQTAVYVDQLWRLLSEDERARADRFYFERDRTRFIVARGLLRTFLGSYLDVDPELLRFSYGPHGKPALSGESAATRLRFNLAHSDGIALCALTLGREVGADVEIIRPLPDGRDIAARCFSARENAVLRQLPARDWTRAFFNCWTRKEAYLKATGDGLAHPLDAFDVSLAPGEPAKLIRVHGNPREASRWSLLALEPVDGVVGALAVEGHGWSAACRHWPDDLPGPEEEPS